MAYKVSTIYQYQPDAQMAALVFKVSFYVFLGKMRVWPKIICKAGQSMTPGHTSFYFSSVLLLLAWLLSVFFQSILLM